jgi:phage tail sheath protein FI
MPTTPTYPGVYIEELPSGVRTIAGVSTSITAFVGYAPSGPLDVAVRVLSQGDYDRIFGGLHRDSAMSYAVQQFFANGGTNALIVRTANGAGPASLVLENDAGPVLTVTAADAGAWGNGVSLDVDYATANPDSTFNLTVSRFEDQGGRLVVTASEEHRNLSMSASSANYVQNAVGGSTLINATRSAGLAFGAGVSRSADLSSFAFAEDDRRIDGMLDGGTPFGLTIAGALPGDLDEYVTALTAAIAAAGLSARMTAERVDPLGVAAAGGDHVQLTSALTGEASAVQVTSAGRSTGLGLINGGREIDGSAATRPAQTGTTSADLGDVMGTSLTLPTNIRIRIDDRSVPSVSPAPTIVAETALAELSTSVAGPDLAVALQAAIRGVGHEATDGATVQLNGTRLRIVPSAATPNATITFVSGGAAGGLRTTDAAGGSTNVQAYSLGVGPEVGNQSGATLGSDGTPPGGTALIGSPEAKTGMNALLDVDLFNILCIPRTAELPEAEAGAVISAGLALAEAERAFYIVDVDRSRDLTTVETWADGLDKSKNGAVYFPRVNAADPLDNFRVRDMAASGALAGIYARTDAERGVWKAPAGTAANVRGVRGLQYTLTDGENGLLNPAGINVLRTFPDFGTVSWGARTLQGADAQASEWKYVPIRRLALFIEESLFRGTQWVVFEENDEPLWAQIRLNLGAFMQRLFTQGAFQGSTPQAAYFVKCDAETTTATDRNLGIVNIVVGFAPLKPAEFVILKIQQIADQDAA